ncbi:MAG: hypothetical protein NVSMB42_22670 [Herpetosiphon sp.]
MTQYKTPGTNKAARTVVVSDPTPPELRALAHLEATPNALRLRIAQIAPDQIYRGTADDLSVAESVALAVEREKQYGDALRRTRGGETVVLEEPQPSGLFIDRIFHDDLAMFFDLRRATLDHIRSLGPAEWERNVELRDVGQLAIRELAQRLEQHDMQMLELVSRQRQHWLRTSGVDELRDGGVAGHLSPNLAQ